jgi:hypothetical protein
MIKMALEFAVPLVGLWMQPSTRFYLQHELKPIFWTTWKSMLWSEFWCQTWMSLLSPFPKLLLVPNYNTMTTTNTAMTAWSLSSSSSSSSLSTTQQQHDQVLVLLPQCIHNVLVFTNVMVEKFTRSILTKTIQYYVKMSMVEFLETVVEFESWYNEPPLH